MLLNAGQNPVEGGQELIGILTGEDERRPDLEHGKMPDPEAKAISCLFDQIRALEKKVEDLTGRLEKAEAKPVKAPARRSTAKAPAAKSTAKAATKAPTASARKKEKSEA